VCVCVCVCIYIYIYIYTIIKRPTGNISKSFRKYLSNRNGKHAVVTEPQKKKKKAALRNAHILGKTLMWEYKAFIIGHNVTLQPENSRSLFFV